MPRGPAKTRPADFIRDFDARTLFYDCFWSVNGDSILLVGPPSYGIDYDAATFTASGVPLQAQFFSSLSTMLTELRGAPAETRAVRIAIAGETHELTVNQNASRILSGGRVMFTISKDNDLAWIREWAEYHARAHGTDTVVLFDNASTRYDVLSLNDALRGISGVRHAIVLSLPQSFGPFDPGVMINPEWARFLQICSMSIVLRRFGALAQGLLNCDIDELVGTYSGRSIYDLARDSRGGLIVFRGTWIESGGGRRHRDFTRRLVGKGSLSSQRKWCLDPSRDWVKRLSVHPYWHWIAGRAPFSKSMPVDATYWHFKGINTNWKEKRNAPPNRATIIDERLVSAMRAAGLTPSAE